MNLKEDRVCETYCMQTVKKYFSDGDRQLRK